MKYAKVNNMAEKGPNTVHEHPSRLQSLVAAGGLFFGACSPAGVGSYADKTPLGHAAMAKTPTSSVDLPAFGANVEDLYALGTYNGLDLSHLGLESVRVVVADSRGGVQKLVILDSSTGALYTTTYQNGNYSELKPTQVDGWGEAYYDKTEICGLDRGLIVLVQQRVNTDNVALVDVLDDGTMNPIQVSSLDNAIDCVGGPVGESTIGFVAGDGVDGKDDQFLAVGEAVDGRLVEAKLTYSEIFGLDPGKTRVSVYATGFMPDPSDNGVARYGYTSSNNVRGADIEVADGELKITNLTPDSVIYTDPTGPLYSVGFSPREEGYVYVGLDTGVKKVHIADGQVAGQIDSLSIPAGRLSYSRKDGDLYIQGESSIGSVDPDTMQYQEFDDNTQASAVIQVDLSGEGTTNPTDTDVDGVSNDVDNCPSDSNPGQEDMDLDGQGDACDTDVDGDEVLNAEDCAEDDGTRWEEQIAYLDADGDGLGAGDPMELCTDGFLPAGYEEKDGDQCPDVYAVTEDGCLEDPTPTLPPDDPTPQETPVPDSDGDGVSDGEDNCPTKGNPGQDDADGDGEGDKCDDTPNGDPTTPTPTEAPEGTEPPVTPTDTPDKEPNPQAQAPDSIQDSSDCIDTEVKGNQVEVSAECEGQDGFQANIGPETALEFVMDTDANGDSDTRFQIYADDNIPIGGLAGFAEGAIGGFKVVSGSQKSSDGSGTYVFTINDYSSVADILHARINRGNGWEEVYFTADGKIAVSANISVSQENTPTPIPTPTPTDVPGAGGNNGGGGSERDYGAGCSTNSNGKSSPEGALALLGGLAYVATRRRREPQE